MSFPSAGDIDTLVRSEAVRVPETTNGDGANGRAPQITSLKAVEGFLEIHGSIMTSRKSVPSGLEELYVHRMSDHCAYTADVLERPPSISLIDVQLWWL